MNTRHDRNYASFEGSNLHIARRVFNPEGDPDWGPGSWQDTLKLCRVSNSEFTEIAVLQAGTEDAVDVGTDCCRNRLHRFEVDGGKYVLTLKSESCHNTLSRWHLLGHGRAVDIEIGGWSSQNTGPSVGNVFSHWTSAENRPVTYCYRYGCRPTMHGRNFKHLWWRSAGLSVHWTWKYFWHSLLGQPDI